MSTYSLSHLVGSLSVCAAVPTRGTSWAAVAISVAQLAWGAPREQRNNSAAQKTGPISHDNLTLQGPG